jgi:hypothetical protein
LEEEGAWGTPPLPPPTGEVPEGVAVGVTVSYQVVQEVWGITEAEGVTAEGAGTTLETLETTGAEELDQLGAGAELEGMG